MKRRLFCGGLLGLPAALIAKRAIGETQPKPAVVVGMDLSSKSDEAAYKAYWVGEGTPIEMRQTFHISKPDRRSQAQIAHAMHDSLARALRRNKP